VAVLGSLVASHYASAIGKVPGFAGAPGQVARRSLGAALQVAAGAGERGPALAAAAKSAFVDAMGLAFVVAASVALFAAAMIARFMPARGDAKGLDGGIESPPTAAPGRPLSGKAAADEVEVPAPAPEIPAPEIPVPTVTPTAVTPP
jgi:hypothetical protein